VYIYGGVHNDTDYISFAIAEVRKSLAPNEHETEARIMQMSTSTNLESYGDNPLKSSSNELPDSYRLTYYASSQPSIQCMLIRKFNLLGVGR
jgi:hypothetical protein